MWAIGVAGTPIPEDQWPSDTIEIKGTPAHYSVALGRRPVNYFQIEAPANFRNHNGSGFAAAGLRNAVGKITIFACRFTILCCIARVENFVICKAAFEKALFVYPEDHLEMRPGCAGHYRRREDRRIRQDQLTLLTVVVSHPAMITEARRPTSLPSAAYDAESRPCWSKSLLTRRLQRLARPVIGREEALQRKLR